MLRSDSRTPWRNSFERRSVTTQTARSTPLSAPEAERRAALVFLEHER
ncbi:hypothetical protein [Natrinema sp. 74]